MNNPACDVTFSNDMPSGSPYRITKILASFKYSDGSESSDPRNGPRDVNLGPGDTSHLISKPDSCVKSIWMWLTYDGPTNGTFDDEYPTSPDGQCYEKGGFALAPATLIPENTSTPGPHPAPAIWDPQTGSLRYGSTETSERSKKLAKSLSP